VADADERT